MQVGEAEAVALVDEDRVDVGDVDARFNNRGRHEDVDLAVEEPNHDVFELVLGHLPVRDLGDGLWHDRVELLADDVDVLDSVVDEVDLPLAVELAQDGFANLGAIEFHDLRRDGTSALGWRRQT